MSKNWMLGSLWESDDEDVYLRVYAYICYTFRDASDAVPGWTAASANSEAILKLERSCRQNWHNTITALGL
jgi:hypothetical protein